MGPGPGGMQTSAGDGNGYGNGHSGHGGSHGGSGGSRSETHTATAPDHLSQLEQRLRSHRHSFATSPPANIRDFVRAGLPVLDNTIALFFGAHPSKHIYFLESMAPAASGSGFRGPDGADYATLPAGGWGVATNDRGGVLFSWARGGGPPGDQRAGLLAPEANPIVKSA